MKTSRIVRTPKEIARILLPIYRKYNWWHGNTSENACIRTKAKHLKQDVQSILSTHDGVDEVWGTSFSHLVSERYPRGFDIYVFEMSKDGSSGGYFYVGSVELPSEFWDETIKDRFNSEGILFFDSEYE